MAVNSVLGEQCGSVAKIVKGTNAEFANLPQFLQSSHSPTAMLRILFKKMAFRHCEPCDSKARQSTNPRKWILGMIILLAQNLWIATPLTRLAMTIKPQFYKSRRRQDLR